jgi:hypothetical protein
MDHFIFSAGRALKGLRRFAGAAILAAALGTPAAHAAQYTPTAAITLPGGVSSTSFDIGYVDTTLGKYFLASRDEKGILSVNTSTLAANVIGAGQFQGIQASNVSGPNGIITVNHNEVWGGDGNGQIRVYNATSGALITTIGPVIGTITAQNRADEACWDPSHNVVVWAWDEPVDNFIAFINTSTHQVISTIKMNGTNGAPKATNGIEQCQWDARTNLIYLNLPEVNGDATDTFPGGVVVLDGSKAALGNGAIKTVWSVPVSLCNGNQGMAMGPRQEIGLNCSRASATENGSTNGKGNGSVAISDQTGTVLAHFPNIWGGDEMYYDAGAAHYIFSGSNNSPPTLAFVATSPPETEDQAITTSASEHSVAADFVHRRVFFPITAAGASLKFCSSVGGNDSVGCVLVLTRQ